MAYTTTFPHHLEIDGVPLSTPAWEALNIQALYGGPARRGENRVIPGASGRRALPRRDDETNRTISLAIFGFERWDGESYPDPVAGLWENLAHLRANVLNQPLTLNTTRTAVIHRPDAPDLTATIQVLGFEVDDEPYSPAAIHASMDITLISGSFE
jgi:hypothetical protein